MNQEFETTKYTQYITLAVSYGRFMEKIHCAVMVMHCIVKLGFNEVIHFGLMMPYGFKIREATSEQVLACHRHAIWFVI